MIGPIAKIAAVTALICAVIGSLWLFPGSAAPAFGDVIDSVAKARSASFTLRQKLGNQPVLISKMYLQGDAIRMDLVGMEGPQEAVEKMQNETQRRSLTALVSTIGDVARKETLQLDHFRKTYQRTAMDDRFATQFTSANILAQFRHVKSQDAKWLREESQNGRTIDVYLVTHVDLMGLQADLAGTEGQRMTVQVDRGTSLPVTILLEVPTDREGKSRDWFEFSGFTWNEPLDPSVFSLDVPEGYTPAPPITPD